MQFLQFYGVDWIATICGLLGVYLLGNKNKFGFALFMTASIGWISFGILTGSFPVIVGSTIFFTMHLRGFLKWNKEAKILKEETIG